MIQKYLRKGSFALAMAMVAAGCSHDLGDYSEEQMAIDHAQSTLGFYIPADQDWVMSSLVNANLPVEGLSGESYTVKVYSNNPLTDSVAYILDMKTVPAGGNYVSEFRYPTYMTSFYVGLTDSNGQTTYKMAMLNNGQITELISVSAARALTRAAFPNANEWAATWLVPDPLTEGQKLRVYRYFQTHPNLTYVDPHLTNFFVQQVYKGGDDALSGGSPEKYTSAANQTFVGSERMDHLTAGSDRQHIYNYNNGTCSWNNNVMDNGTQINDNKQHSDQIQLMLDAKTDCFGYWNSEGSVGHELPYCALVSAAVIDAWAESEGNGIGEPVVDKWNRSFLGFDFEQLTGDNIYAKDWQAPYGIMYYREDLYGKTYPYLNSDQNQYTGDFLECNDTDLQEEGYVKNLLNQGYLPVSGGADKKWVKLKNCADGYFTDWIVTLCEAKRITPETPENPGNTSGSSKEEMQIWSYAFEDSNLKSDYDMNDVVIKVQETMNGTLKVMLVAAGCEYDNKVYLDDTLIRWDNDTEEVHDALGGTHGLTVNTGWHSGRSMATAEIAKPANYDPQTANWRIVPSGGDMEDKYIGVATTGSQPTGIVIPYDWEWPTERTNICDAYNRFSQWASSTTDLRKATSDWYISPSGSVMK
ncbi:MAG: DUF4842 domain-containing protein [Prevotella sp.]|nr:DUF4842 domain-containing protein [Prevotella sp.]